MLSVVDWTAMLRAARAHLAEVESLITALEPLANAEAGDGGLDQLDGTAVRRPGRFRMDGRPLGPPAKAPGRPPGHAAGGGKATGRPPASALGRPAGRPDRVLAEAAKVHAAGRPIAGLGTNEAVRAILAASGPATSRQITDRLTAAGWQTRTPDRTRSHRVDTSLSAQVKRGAVRKVRARGASGPGVYALAEAPPAAVAKLAAAAARLGAGQPAEPPRRHAGRTRPGPGKRPHASTGKARPRSGVPLDARIVRVLGAKPNRTAPEILAALVADGWTTTATNPLNVVRAMLSTLLKAKAIAVERSANPYAYRLTAAKAKAARKAKAAGKAKAGGAAVNGAKANDTPAGAPSSAAPIADYLANMPDPSTTTEH